ncbi:MAG: hypothetical protein ACE5E0_04375 [Terriglobia bacterium]
MIPAIGVMTGSYVVVRMADLIVQLFFEREDLPNAAVMALFILASVAIVSVIVSLVMIFQASQEIEEALLELPRLQK